LWSVSLTFAHGSADGAKVCASITTHYDDVVEPEEYFTVTLSLATTSATGLKLGNAKTVVTVTDSDGK
jgi:phosphate/sulfate permease